MELQKCSFKVLLIGDRGVGRGTLLRNFTSGGFNAKGYLNTIGAEFRVKDLEIEGFSVRLMIHNVSYAEEHRLFFPSFIRESRVALLMFDITKSESLNYLSELPEVIRKYAGEIPIYLIGNKLDLKGTHEVFEEEGRNFARFNNIVGCIEISAKEGQGCEELFEMLARVLFTPYKFRV